MTKKTVHTFLKTYQKLLSIIFSEETRIATKNLPNYASFRLIFIHLFIKNMSKNMRDLVTILIYSVLVKVYGDIGTSGLSLGFEECGCKL